MKAKPTIAVLFLFIVLSGISRANPIIERFFQELAFDTGGWKLEITSHWTNLDGWSLESKAGRSYFKNGIRSDTGRIIITNSDLLTPLAIDQQDDSLTLFHSSSVAFDRLAFSAVRPAMVAPPHWGQSICCATASGDYFCWYIDNTPTLGRANDFVNATGIVRGTVRDVNGNPVSGATVAFGHSWWTPPVTDSEGKFQVSFAATNLLFRFSRTGNLTVEQWVQIQPDSTVVVDIVLGPKTIYPLNIGDRWNWGFERKITGDTLMPNGKRYSIHSDPSQRSLPLQRFENNKVYAYEFKGKTDQLVYDFSRLAGDTIATIFRPTDTTDIILTWTGETNLFGRLRQQWGFLTDVRRMIDEELYQVITDSVGVTHEGGMWFSFDLLGAMINGVQYGTITDVHEPGRLLPIEFKLYQNYPNPFNPVTNFQFSIAKRGLANLKVYDMLGREVATLVNEVKHAGTYTVQWDASGQASGVYFYRLHAGNFVATRRLLLLK